MHGDPDPLAGAPPSRSQRRREALAVLDLAARLAALPPARVDRLDLPGDVREEIAHVRRILAPVARKRQLQFLAKLMRRHAPAAFAAVRAELGADEAAHRVQVAAERRLESLRGHLLDAGDAALDALLLEHPGADRRHLRALVRSARSERAQGRPPRAARALLRALRELDRTAADEPATRDPRGPAD